MDDVFRVVGRLTASQLAYLAIMQGIGAAIIDAGANFGIATAMYKDSSNAVSVWILPGSLAGDAIITLLVQTTLTWVIAGLLTRSDSRGGRVAPLQVDNERVRAAAVAAQTEAAACSQKNLRQSPSTQVQVDGYQASAHHLSSQGVVSKGMSNECDATKPLDIAALKADASLPESQPVSQPDSQAANPGSHKHSRPPTGEPSRLSALLDSMLTWLLLAGDFDFLSSPGSPAPSPVTAVDRAPLPPLLLFLCPSTHPSSARTFRLFLSVLRGLIFAALTAIPLWPLAVLPLVLIWGGDDDISRWPGPQVYKSVLGGCVGALLTPVVAVIALLEEGRVRAAADERETRDTGNELIHEQAGDGPQGVSENGVGERV